MINRKLFFVSEGSLQFGAWGSLCESWFVCQGSVQIMEGKGSRLGRAAGCCQTWIRLSHLHRWICPSAQALSCHFHMSLGWPTGFLAGGSDFVEWNEELPVCAAVGGQSRGRPRTCCCLWKVLLPLAPLCGAVGLEKGMPPLPTLLLVEKRKLQTEQVSNKRVHLCLLFSPLLKCGTISSDVTTAGNAWNNPGIVLPGVEAVYPIPLPELQKRKVRFPFFLLLLLLSCPGRV